MAGQQGDAFSGITLGRDGTTYDNVVSDAASRAGVWSRPPRRDQGNRPDRLGRPRLTHLRRGTRKRLYITDAGFAEPHDAKVQRGTINPAALHCGPTA
ncbi:hypothetical protein [Streptomyces sp. A012304]|uniref:hypothetical protein n=1 Tax=Streptomyces sp. A012304 TaxID=375446 RepID=UPI002231456D|nr:hypothetical protein [Streptomyces sp. A012304]GKQ41940.1 hypothetical protein ALMP_84520 [Streptomyces sp. A012304]